VRTLGVEAHHPGIELVLGGRQVVEDPTREELRTERPMETSILPVVVGLLGAVSR
jgi:hypothetical protein